MHPLQWASLMEPTCTPSYFNSPFILHNALCLMDHFNQTQPWTTTTTTTEHNIKPRMYVLLYRLFEYIGP